MVAQLIAEAGTLKGLVFALDDGDEWIMGRDIDQCNLVLEDLSASRRHLLCHRTDDGYEIENLSETHPVLVNDAPIEGPYLLQEGDLLKVGGTLFRFYLHPPKEEEFFKNVPVEMEEVQHDTIYEEEEVEKPKVHLDLTPTSRFMMKVLAGPNTGAEFALEPGSSYLLGTDSTTCDIIFHDLSISREHARISITPEGDMTIEDLDSRNGVIVDRERIVRSKQLLPNTVVVVGTSSFLILDREAEAATIAAPIFQPPLLEEEAEVEEEEETEIKEAEKKREEAPSTLVPHLDTSKKGMSRGLIILSFILIGLIVLFGAGIVSLFQTSEVKAAVVDYRNEIDEALQPFPGVRYTFNPATNRLFLVGHVLTGVKKNEMLHNLEGLPFIRGIEDNVVNDEAVWQEMNLLLALHPEFRGVAMHSPKPGLFVLTGYLQSQEQANELTNYMNAHFNYIQLLENRVVVDETVMNRVTSLLTQGGFAAINPTFANGELTLTGYANSTQMDNLKTLISEFEQLHGVRFVKNFVVAVSPEQGVIDLNSRFPGRYLVTGYSKHGNVNLNVVINGRILTRGDQLDGMTITSIQPRTVFLEREGLKYKITFNE